MALLLRRGAAVAARTLRAAAASSASTSVHRLPTAGSLAAARNLPTTHFFLLEIRRGFAKGKKSKNDSRSDTVEAAPDIGPTVKSAATAQMDTAVVALSRELSKLRTGRASPGMLDHIMVETGDVKVGLSRIAVVSVLDSHTLSVMPYDPNEPAMP
uniref:Ribosome-recycling factor, chloroplastic n=1 Tax=Triticum urartu TaxID=4572 RepID=A0A8R7PHI5_TRIUA